MLINNYVQEFFPNVRHNHLHRNSLFVIWSCTRVTPDSTIPNNDQRTTEDISTVKEIYICRLHCTLYIPIV